MNWAQDVRFAMRMIRTHPWFSAAVITTLALGIGVNTTVFSLVNAVLFKPLPFPGGDRLVVVNNNELSKGRDRMGVSYVDFREFREQASSFEFLEAMEGDSVALSESGNPPARYRLGRVSSGMFQMIQTAPILGRGFGPEDDKAGAPAILMLSYGVWADRYGNSPSVIGRAVRVGEKPAVIVGVMPEGFKFPVGEELWIPLVPTAKHEDRSWRSLMLIGITKAQASMAEARADLDVIAKRLEKEHPDTNKGVGVAINTFHQQFNGGPIRLIFTLMLGAVGFVLLIACANVANMMLSRAVVRQREVSIRAAMGASRWQLMRQLLIESVMLSGIGGLLGLALAKWGTHLFGLAVANVGKPYWIDFTMDHVVFLYCAVVCLLAGLLFGLFPALQASRVDLNTALKEGARGTSGGRGGWLSGSLVAFQFMLAVVLLTGAGLLMRSFLAHQQINAWLPGDKVLTARISLPEARYADKEARQRFFEELLPRLEAVPGAESVAIVSNPPGSGAAGWRMQIEGQPDVERAKRPAASVVIHSPGYLQMIGLPIVAGREFTETDGAPGKEVAVVSRAFAAKFFPNETPLGKRFRLYDDDKPKEWITVVGMCGDVDQINDPSRSQDPLVFLPYRQEGFPSMALMVRASRSPSALAPAVRTEVQRIDFDLPLFGVQTLDETLARQRWPWRVFGTVFGIFATVALMMAAVGVYAVMAQATTRRTQEIGIRMALGSTSGRILRAEIWRGLKQLGIGLALGIGIAFAVTRVMSRILYKVSPSDPLTFSVVAAMLIAVGLLACWLPARKASLLDPVKALRYE